MITEYETKQIKINKPLRGYKPGAKVPVEFVGGKPKERYWRDRLADSKIDNCVEVISAASKPKPKSMEK